MSRSIAFISLVAATTMFGAGDRYPGTSASRSFDGGWLVSYVPASEGRSHRLLLADVHGSNRKEMPLLGFDRSCDVLWAPDSRRLALTDWGGSNFAEVVIAEIGEKPLLRELDVSDVRRNMTPEEIHGHCYYEAVQWVDHDSLRIRVFGHADEAPLHDFEYSFVVSLRSGTAKLLKKENQSNQIIIAQRASRVAD